MKTCEAARGGEHHNQDRVSKRSETFNFYNLSKLSRTNHINNSAGWRRVETPVGRCELRGVRWCGVTTPV